MTQDEAFNQVRNITADVLGIDARKITPDSAPDNIDIWDSVQHLNLVLALEERFNTSFEPEEIDSMKTVGSIAALIRRRNAS